MYDTDKLSRLIFQIKHPDQFNELALKIFYLQYKNNQVYRKFCDLIDINISDINSFSDIPFLPVELFKNHSIYTAKGNPEFEFHSSGTTSRNKSTHLVFNSELYKQGILNGFKCFYGDVESYCFIALIPTMTEHPDSSLAFMAGTLIKESKYPYSGFYLGRESLIPEIINSLRDRKIFIFGLSYALTDFALQNIVDVSNGVVMETGGMKGRSNELIREELHQIISGGMKIKDVHSEYSMCELFSQAYSKANGIFHSPPWMKILVRDANDPFTILDSEKTGGINIIDLANIHTCSFIATQDLGRINKDGGFEVLGRFDSSDLRGCSLMI